MVAPWIMVPLYIYPLVNTTWQPLYSAVQANPSVTFRVIINPNSGPGPAGSFPDKNYIAGISKLRSYSNTKLLGYVDTAYAERNYKEATVDVDTYTAWKNYKKADIRMDGIFFDDNPSSDDVSDLSYLTNITKYARKKMGNSAHISLNPGTVVSDKWYTMADSIVAFENYYREFKASTSPNTVKAAQKAKSVFIVHTFPNSGTGGQLTKLVQDIHKTGGIAASYITTFANYDGLSSNFLSTYARAVTAISGSSTSNNKAVTGGTTKGTGRTNKRDGSDEAESFADAEDLDVESDLEARDPAPLGRDKQQGTSTVRTTTSKPTPKPSPKPKSKTTTSKSSSVVKHTSTTTSKPTKKPTSISGTAKSTQSTKTVTSTRKPTIDRTKRPLHTITSTSSRTAPSHVHRAHARSFEAQAQPIAVA